MPIFPPPLVHRRRIIRRSWRQAGWRALARPAGRPALMQRAKESGRAFHRRGGYYGRPSHNESGRRGAFLHPNAAAAVPSSGRLSGCRALAAGGLGTTGMLGHANCAAKADSVSHLGCSSLCIVVLMLVSLVILDKEWVAGPETEV